MRNLVNVVTNIARFISDKLLENSSVALCVKRIASRRNINSFSQFVTRKSKNLRCGINNVSLSKEKHVNLDKPIYYNSVSINNGFSNITNPFKENNIKYTSVSNININTSTSNTSNVIINSYVSTNTSNTNVNSYVSGNSINSYVSGNIINTSNVSNSNINTCNSYINTSITINTSIFNKSMYTTCTCIEWAASKNLSQVVCREDAHEGHQVPQWAKWPTFERCERDGGRIFGRGVTSMREIKAIVVHTAGAGTSAPIYQKLEQIREYHVRHRGWSDIGYHKVVEYDPSSGRSIILQGRPDNVTGAHVAGFNANSIGICVTGNGDIADFTQSQKRVLVDAIARLIVRHGLVWKFRENPKKVVLGHREVPLFWGIPRIAKTCPGKKVNMDEIREMVNVRLDAITSGSSGSAYGASK